MRMRGFEPPRPYRALDPESSASANFATSATFTSGPRCLASSQLAAFEKLSITVVPRKGSSLGDRGTGRFFDRFGCDAELHVNLFRRAADTKTVHADESA
jgi:hypothetical protein